MVEKKRLPKSNLVSADQIGSKSRRSKAKSPRPRKKTPKRPPKFDEEMPIEEWSKRARLAEPEDHLIENILPDSPGAYGIVAARTDLGKTNTDLHLGFCLATGRPFFGIPCAKVGVSMVAFEGARDGDGRDGHPGLTEPVPLPGKIKGENIDNGEESYPQLRRLRRLWSRSVLALDLPAGLAAGERGEGEGRFRQSGQLGLEVLPSDLPAHHEQPEEDDRSC